MKIEYVEVGLETIMRFFAKSFKSKDGKIVNSAFFIDTQKEKVVFKLIVDDRKGSAKESEET